jgi:plasmid maintenance system antidote protein VapI
MKENPNDIEDQLKQAIRGCGISCYRLAEISGVHRTVLSNFLSGRRSLTLTTAAKLTRTLGLELIKTSKADFEE